MVTVEPTQAEALLRGLASALSVDGQVNEVQRSVLEVLGQHLFGVSTPTGELAPLTPTELAVAITDENLRERVVHGMVALEILANPVSPEVVKRVEAYAAALSVDEGMLAVARDYSAGAMSVATGDLLRNSYVAEYNAAHGSDLTQGPTGSEDPALAAKWNALQACGQGTLGRTVWDFYQTRGFTFPGLPGAVDPLLAQHDWVHCLADYGTSATGEIEVFTFLASAIPDAKGFSYAVIILGLFETGYVSLVPGVATASPGHLSLPGGSIRFVDALRRGLAMNLDVMGGIDWFDYANEPLDEVRRKLGVLPKSDVALRAGSLSALDPNAIFSRSS
jgi:hypothetical protein